MTASLLEFSLQAPATQYVETVDDLLFRLEGASDSVRLAQLLTQLGAARNVAIELGTRGQRVAFRFERGPGGSAVASRDGARISVSARDTALLVYSGASTIRAD